MGHLWAVLWAALAAAAVITAEKWFVPARLRRAGAPAPNDDGSADAAAPARRGPLPWWILVPVCLWAAVCGSVVGHVEIGVLTFKATAGFAILTFTAVTDYALTVVPNKAVFALLLCRLIAAGWELLTGEQALWPLATSALAALVWMALLGVLRWISHNGIGLGDVKLLAALAFLWGPYTAFLTLLLGMLLCAGLAVVLVLMHRKKLKDTIPLGPALWVGYGLVILLAMA